MLGHVCHKPENQTGIRAGDRKEDKGKPEESHQYFAAAQSQKNLHRWPEYLSWLNTRKYSQKTPENIRSGLKSSLLNKNIEFMKYLWLERNEVTSGSRVPRIESHIKFTKSVVEMIQSLPNSLDYAEHIKHFEREIEWAKKDKQQEMKSDFIGWTD